MALRFVDGFDHYVFNSFTPDTIYLYAKWTGHAVPGGGGVAQGPARFGIGGLQCYNTSYVYKDLDAQPTWIVGCAFNPQYSAAETALIQIFDGATAQVELRHTSTGKIQLTRAGTQLAIGTLSVSPYVWHYVELKVTINNSTGSIEGRVDGVSHASASSVDTQNTGNATANRIGIGAPGINAQLQVDDVYICDGTGSSPTNNFLGDIKIETLMPNGNGNYSQLVGQDADSTNNYLNVDESTNPDNDTTYNESSTVGNKDTYAYTDLVTTTGSVYGVQPVVFARKTDAGTRKIASMARLSATDVDSADSTLSTNYQYFMDIREAKPGGGAWSITDVNNAEFGVKVTA